MVLDRFHEERGHLGNDNNNYESVVKNHLSILKNKSVRVSCVNQLNGQMHYHLGAD